MATIIREGGDPPPVLTQVGPVLPDDRDGKFTPIQSFGTIGIDYRINNRFEKDLHVYMMGVTAPQGLSSTTGTGNTPSVAFVQLASPTLLWIADWTCAKYNEKPKIPDPNRVQPGWILLDEHIEPGMLALAPDGTSPLYRISGTYVFGHTNPDPITLRNCRFSRAPWMQDFVSRDVPTSLWETNLIDSGGVQPPPPGVIRVQ